MTATTLARAPLLSLTRSQAGLPKDLDADPTSADSQDRGYRLGAWGLELWGKVAMPEIDRIRSVDISLIDLADLSLQMGCKWREVLDALPGNGFMEFPLHYADAARLHIGLQQPYGSEWLLAMRPIGGYVAYFGRRAELHMRAKPLTYDTQMPGSTQLLVARAE